MAKVEIRGTMRCKLSYKGGTCVEVDSSGNENFISLADCTEDRTCRSLYPDHPFCNKETGACLQRCCYTFQISQSVTKVSLHYVTPFLRILLKYCAFHSKSRFYQQFRYPSISNLYFAPTFWMFLGSCRTSTVFEYYDNLTFFSHGVLLANQGKLLRKVNVPCIKCLPWPIEISG